MARIMTTRTMFGGGPNWIDSPAIAARRSGKSRWPAVNEMATMPTT